MSELEGFGCFMAVVFIILLLVFGPLLTIWALNTLFPVLVIPYTFKTWLAIVALSGSGFGAVATAASRANK